MKMGKAAKKFRHFSFPDARQFEPEIARIRRIQIASHESPLLQHRRPARERRPGGNVRKIGEPDFPVAKARRVKVKQDLPGKIVEQPRAE